MSEPTVWGNIANWFHWRWMAVLCLFKGHVMRRERVYTKQNQETEKDGCACERCCETWQFIQEHQG